jgi:hypothetical protein
MAKTSGNKSETPEDMVFCRSCNQRYPRTALIRRSWSSPGIRRPGGPTGARRETWMCCPKGHKINRVSFRVS